MRLFGLPVLFCFSLATSSFATTLATASVNCVTTSNTQTNSSAAGANCFSNVGPFSYSAGASAIAFTVSANAFSSNPALVPQVGAHARFEGDFLLTLLGGTGTGSYYPTFYFPQWDPGTHETDSVDAIFNAITVYHRDSSGLPSTSGVQAPFTFGQPIPLHIVMTANALTDGITNEGPAFISLQLSGFTALSGDCTRGATCNFTYAYTLIEAPEPTQAFPVLAAIVGGIAFVRRRSRVSRHNVTRPM